MWGTGLAWVLAKGEDLVPIPGTTKRHYLEENVAEAEITLTEEEVAEIEAAVPVDEALANIQFMALADGSSARVIYVGTVTEDMSANATLYKRTLRYSAEYPTTITQLTPAMLFGVENLSANAAFVESIPA